MWPELAAFIRRHGLSDAAQAELDELLNTAAPTSSHTVADERPVATLADMSVGDAPDPIASETLMTGVAARLDPKTGVIDMVPDANATPRYEDLGVLGMGAMGEVRRVRDLSLGRVVAMKILHPHRAIKSSSLARFIDEAQTSSQLSHPGVVPVHELGRLADGRWYFTMREILGANLRERLDAEPPQTPAQLRRWIEVFRRVCETMAFVHQQGVIHRDLKPDNIMVGDHGEVLVVDWGVAKVVGRDDPVSSTTPIVTHRSHDGDAFHTRDGAITGTPAYMPPEQALGEISRLTPRADVYALGAILYEILAGRPPYQGTTARTVLVTMLSSPPPPLQDLVSQPLPSEVVGICQRAMAKDPGARYASANEMARALVAWLEGTHRRERAQQLVAHARDLFARDPPGLSGVAGVGANNSSHTPAISSPWPPPSRRKPATTPSKAKLPSTPSPPGLPRRLKPTPGRSRIKPPNANTAPI